MTKKELRIGDLFIVQPAFWKRNLYYIGERVIDYSEIKTFPFQELNSMLLYKRVLF